MEFLAAKKSFLDAYLADIDAGRRPAWLKPIALAIRDHGCAQMTVLQHAGPFQIPDRGKPAIVILGDDLTEALGPAAFHLPSLRRLFRVIGAAGVIVAPAVEAYGRVCSHAVLLRQHVALVETRTEFEDAWVTLIRENSDAGIILSREWRH